tara:strand:+ start:690 stop:977 length:288 start_codon:yes stop_codon:yes gene_type:complete
MKINEKVHFDGSDKFVIQTTHSNTPYIEQAKIIRDSGAGVTGDNKLVGRIPMHLVNAWLKEAGIKWSDHEAKKDLIRKKMLSGEFDALRVWKGTY